ncbi:MAG: lipoprotein-releasing ABC transporter permease subunit [bacterium]|nr:lipoprotein-releasing ABC transporter permease subunit [bacterium]
MSFEWFVSIRYLITKRRQAFIPIITLISILGVAVGVMALITVLSVMSGFEKDLTDKILGTNSHIVIYQHGDKGLQDYEKVLDLIKREKRITSSAPFIYGQSILQSKTSTVGVIIRGVEQERPEIVNSVGKNIIEGKLNFGEKGIILGSELAAKLGLSVGDKLVAITKVIMTPMGMMPQSNEFQVVGLFETGMYEYDASLAYISLKSGQKLYGMDIGAVTGIETRVSDFNKAEEISRDLQKSLGEPYWVRSWGDMNRNFFSALKLEKIVMIIIMTLCVLIAAFNIISTLIMIVMEKTKDIGVLKSLGASSGSIRFIFIMLGSIIGLVGTCLGAVSGIWLSNSLDRIIKFIENTFDITIIPADVYYLSKLPTHLEMRDVLFVSIMAVFICTLATLYPAHQASKLNPVEALRYE